MLALAGLVLITACANLASTLAARGADRRRELAIRLSIGAGRARIVRQLLTETVVLASLGGAVGALGATVAAVALSRWQLPVLVPIQFDVQPDAHVFAFAFLVSVVAGLFFGIAPARQAAKTAPAVALKAVDGVRQRRWAARDLLVAAQVALCFVLVAACLSALRGLQQAVMMPLGFQPAGVTMAIFDLGLAGYSRERGEEVRRRALEALQALPGIESVAYANSFPLSIDQSRTNVWPDERRDLRPDDVTRAIKYQISPGFFQTLGIPIRDGRDLDWRDTPTGGRVVVVNEAFATQILQTRDPIGRRVRFGPGGPPVEVVGVVATGKYQTLTEPETPALFEPMLQAYNTTTVVLIRSTRLSGEVAADIRQVMTSIDPAMPLFGVGSVEQMLTFVRLPMRLAAIALGAFGVLAIMLAGTGIYGVVAYAVARRRREIAIRVAIGATQRSVLHLVLRRVATLIAIGAVAGLVLAVAVGDALSAIVYQASPSDGATLGAVALIVGLVGLAACWWPAQRVLRLDPAAALHVE